ncbi:hypothetical protein [Xenorhabdus bovienii]|uniref:Putative Rhs-family protein n=1 Tax=Xenorhabdus bovienii TaxID=40576 RepID=A0A0B6X6Z9_XENBV|nr:hypothetical protein [Xenorhabdus bovienii]CDG89878.1 hypothetical protein XBFFR1_420009 [Xenorhabdus bovienii str. feltiae France]CDG91577.1 hypothetical protein XBFFL1_1650009 [Xenorhabdus bovienii str. feltiae Florida]CDM88104.1 Putative Rhs-family protein [Xenorhabdus bovienii]
MSRTKRVCWLYKPGALTPSARYEKGKLHYMVSDHQGMPREMLNEQDAAADDVGESGEIAGDRLQ